MVTPDHKLPRTVLVADDDPVRCRDVCYAVGAEYPVTATNGLDDTLRVACVIRPNAVVLGWTSSEASHVHRVVDALQSHPQTAQIPILMVAAPGAAAAHVWGRFKLAYEGGSIPFVESALSVRDALHRLIGFSISPRSTVPPRSRYRTPPCERTVKETE